MPKAFNKYPDTSHCSDDEDYIAMLYYKYVNDLFAWGLTYTHQREVIKDCIQDLFVWLLNNRNKLEDIHNMQVYLFTSFRNNLKRLLQERSSGNGSNIELNDAFASRIIDYSSNVLEKLENNEVSYSRRRQVREILRELSGKQKRIIYLKYYMEMDYDEICEVLSMNYQSARTLIYRSIRKMRQVYREIRLIE